MIRVVAGGISAAQEPDPQVGAHIRQERGGLQELCGRAAARVVAAAAGGGILIDEQHARPAARGRERRGEPRGSGADHQHVAEVITLRCSAPAGVQIDPTEAAQVAEHALPAGKQALAVERLVVEADRQEGLQPVEHRQAVVREAAARVDRAHLPAGFDRHDIGAHVGDAAVGEPHLHQGVGVVVGGTQDPARAVIFE